MNDIAQDQTAGTEVPETQEISEAPPDISDNPALDFEIQTDVQVQQAVDEINQVEGIQPEVWENLNAGERLGVLQSIEDRMAGIQGRPPVIIGAREMDASTFGGWNGQAIELNAAHLQSDMPVSEFIDTIVHEGRHAFQDYAIQNPGVVNDENIVNAWAENRMPGNYLRAEEYGQELYLAQPLEADAWAFAGRVTGGLIAANVGRK
ncbi:hypothetical protein FBQ82_07205 [Anaerolineae bacterium CFX7]|nr:hypothetical protein [Anaerolineae bacterium CFX7]